jgi:lysophospholipase L1-like esterase
MRSRSASKAGIILLAVGVTLVASEIGVRIILPFRPRPNGDASLFASRTYRLSANKDLVYELKPNTRATFGGLDFQVNTSGFRDRRFRAAADGRTRIACVGDSLTYGWLVPLRATYHKQLERIMRSEGENVDVLGLGVVGYNLIQDYALIKERIARFKPSIVLLQLGPNDFERTVGVQTIPDAGRFVLLPYHDLIVPFMIYKSGFAKALMRGSHLFRVLNMGLYGLKKKHEPAFIPNDVFMMGEDQAFRHLDKIKALLDREGIPLAVAIFPFRSGVSETYIYGELTRRLRDRLEALKIPYVDLFDSFNGGAFRDIWIDGLHLNEAGYGLAASAIRTLIQGVRSKH